MVGAGETRPTIVIDWYFLSCACPHEVTLLLKGLYRSVQVAVVCWLERGKGKPAWRLLLMGARSTTCHCRRRTAFLFWKYGQIKKKVQGTLGSKCPSWWSKGRPRRLIHKDVMEKHKRTFWPTQYLAHHEWFVLQKSSLSHLEKGLFGGKG